MIARIHSLLVPTQRSPLDLRAVWWALSPRRIGAGVAVWLALSVIGAAAGLLVINLYDDSGLHRREIQLVQWLESNRTSFWNGLSYLASAVGHTRVLIVVVTAFTIFALWYWRRATEAVLVLAAVNIQGSIFWTISRFIDRERPPVEPLDSWLVSNNGTSNSFPSGHTGGATAFCLALAVVIAINLDNRRARVIILTTGTLAAVAVAISRVYRGMHYPTDVAVALIIGAVTVFAVYRIMASLRATDRDVAASPGSRHQP